MKKFAFARITAAVPSVKAGAVTENLHHIMKQMEELRKDNPDLVLFPELSLSAYSCGDLFRQQVLLNQSLQALISLKRASEKWPCPVIVGLPLIQNSLLFNCAAVVASGKILGVVPKTYLPNSNEFYEQRWFSSGKEMKESCINIDGEKVPCGCGLIFRDKRNPLFRFGIEICEDLWSPLPPSTELALGGALLIANPSASNELVGKSDYRKTVTSQQSARCMSAYVYASAGPGESTTDTVYGGHALIYENGHLLAEGERFLTEGCFQSADVDLEFLEHERLNSPSFSQTVQAEKERLNLRFIDYTGAETGRLEETASEKLLRSVNPHPFVPASSQDRETRCGEIFSIQSTGLAARLRHIGCRKVVLGLSGGLDSTLALLVTVEAFRRLDLDLSGLLCYTMPGFGTTSRTKSNAQLLCEEMGIPIETLDIKEVCTLQMKELDHSGTPSDVAYENVQARQRTVYLMNKANMIGGIVIGTGDLSELALGWCTYNGDHMSMYAVNTGVPKTLVRYLVQFVADRQKDTKAAEILYDIIDTPISPELLPPDRKGNIAQKTEDLIGPYELHDFFLYSCVRCGFSPEKTLMLACRAYPDKYDRDTIRKWLERFIRRFFTQQFKRSCLPDGPKVGTIALSPRGDWRMPSDASMKDWLDNLPG